MKSKIDFKSPYTIIGLFLIFHYILLIIDRYQHDMLYNLVWISHLTLLLAAIAFLTRNNLLLSGALVSVMVVHGIWIFDFIYMVVTGLSPIDYTAYVLELPTYRKILTVHHIYLIPLLLFTLLKQKRVDLRGWYVAALLFAFATLSSVLFVDPSYNLNCAHTTCPALLIAFPSLSFLSQLSQITYLVMINLLMGALGFFLPNLVLYGLFSQYVEPRNKQTV